MQRTAQFPGPFEAFVDSGLVTKLEFVKLGTMLDHSWNQLMPDEQDALKGLSVFRGDFTYQAAMEVAGATPQILQVLLEKLFLQISSAGRYVLHQSLRRLGREKLAKIASEEKFMLAKHSNYFLHKLVSLEQELKSPQQEAALSKIDIDYENIRRAWRWALRQRNVTISSRHIETLCLYYDLRRFYQEGISICDITILRLSELTLTPDRLRTLAFLKIWASRLSRLSGNYIYARKLLGEARILVEKAQDSGIDIRLAQAHLYRELGSSAYSKNPGTASRDYTSSVLIFQTLGDTWWLGEVKSKLTTICTLDRKSSAGGKCYEQPPATFQEVSAHFQIIYLQSTLGYMEMHAGNYAIAEEHYRNSLSLARLNTFRRLFAGSLTGLGWLALMRADFQKAKAILCKSVNEYRQINHQDELSWTLSALGHSMIEIGETVSGWSNLREALMIGKEADSPQSLYHVMAYIALQRAKQGYLEEAVEFYSLACQHPMINGSCWFEDVIGKYISKAATDLPPDRCAVAKARGQERDLDDTVEKLLTKKFHLVDA